MNRHHHNRREFLGLTGASVIGLASGSLLDAVAFAEKESADFDPRYADLVVFNAKVYPVDPNIPKAEAFAVKGSRRNSKEICTKWQRGQLAGNHRAYATRSTTLPTCCALWI